MANSQLINGKTIITTASGTPNGDVTTTLISGFIHDLLDYDGDQLSHIPHAIEHLIVRYYIMDHLRVQDDSSLGGVFEWRFHTQSDISRFRNCSNEEILKSSTFMMNQCIFHFQLVRIALQYSLQLVVTSLPSDTQCLLLTLSVQCREIGFDEIVSGSIAETSATIGPDVSMKFGAFSNCQQWTFEMNVTLRSVIDAHGELIYVRDQWIGQIVDLAKIVWKRHENNETKDSALAELRSMLNAPKSLAGSLAEEVMNRIDAEPDLMDIGDLQTFKRQPTIEDAGDYQIIPHDYLDNILEEAVQLYQTTELRQGHVQRRLQRHLPEPVAHTLSETLVQSVKAEDTGMVTDGVPIESTNDNVPVDADNAQNDQWEITFVYEQKNLSIFSMPEEIELVGDVLIIGFVNKLYGFDAVQLNRTPKEIYHLIHHYHMMIATLPNDDGDRVEESGNERTENVYEGQFEWRFENESDISLFRSCQKDDVLQSVSFMVNGCVFQLELSPNGRGSVVDDGQCTLWLTVSSLPEGISAVPVSLNIKCKEIDFECTESDELYEPGGSEQYGFGNSNMVMDRVLFDNVERWTFEIRIDLATVHPEDETMVFCIQKSL